MTTLTPLSPETVAARLKAGDVTLVDIREPDEFVREHIAGAVSVPLSRLETGDLAIEPQRDIVFHCRSGGRTGQHCDRLAARIDGRAYVLEGGLQAWRGAGLDVVADATAPLELNRQVQIAAGGSALAGAVLAALVHPGFIIVPGLIGAGLVFAGVTGWCGMAHLLAAAPWNTRAA